MKQTVNMIALAVLAMLATWYFVDGRYQYKQDGSLVYRIDRMTGDRCFGANKGTSWVCN
jgi:hypothetical protein